MIKQVKGINDGKVEKCKVCGLISSIYEICPCGYLVLQDQYTNETKETFK